MSKQNEAQSTELVAVQTAITRMDKLTEGLKDLAQRFGGIVFDVKTPKGMAEAKAARREIAGPRIDVEKIRKEAKAPILELGRKLDAEAARITRELAKIEDPIAAQIKAEEDRVENERLERARREEQRVADITARIDAMHTAVNGAARARLSVDVVRFLADVQAVVVDVDHFAEQIHTAAAVKADAIAQIERIRDELVARETEAERLRKDREDFERNRAAQEAIDKAAREKRDAEIAAEDAERRRVAAIEENNRRAIAEREQAERNKENERIAAEQAAAQKVIDDQRRELEARQQAERDAHARRERELHEMRMGEIQSMGHQVMIATGGRLGVRKGGTRECIVETLAETEAWTVTDEKFGPLIHIASAAKASACSQIEALLVEFDDAAAEAERRRNFRPTFDEIVALLAANYRVEPAKVRTWITEAKPAKRAAA